jgi:hypothetical protein
MQSFGMIGVLIYCRWETVESAACLIPRCGGVGSILFYPAVQLRKCRPASRFFSFGQTLTGILQDIQFLFTEDM